jgi:hypothetical protein
MSIRVYVHASRKRAETPALLDSGATENFINVQYAKQLRLPVKRLLNPRKVFNVDGTTNKKGDIEFYTDLETRAGETRTNMRFFLTDLGPQKLILGYPWFAAVQPKIDWAKGWIDYTQLPVVLKTTQAAKGHFMARIVGGIRKSVAKIRHALQTKASQLAEKHDQVKKTTLPARYQRHAHVFSEQQAHRLPTRKLWDHAIELKPDAPNTLPGKIYSLTQPEQLALQDFIKEHLEKGYIRCHRPPVEACVRMPSVRSSPRKERMKVGRARVSVESGLGLLRMGLE